MYDCCFEVFFFQLETKKILQKTVTFKNRQPSKGLIGCILTGCKENMRNYYQLGKIIFYLNHDKSGFQIKQKSHTYSFATKSCKNQKNT